ncbi:IS481 family transposase [Emticicia fontis]
MTKLSTKAQARKKWLEIYYSCGSISKAALKCGIARSTLQRWIKRQSDDGEKDLEDKSKRPHRLALQKIDTSIENLVLKVRQEFKYGKMRICSHLLRIHNLKVSPSTVGRILKHYATEPLKRYRKNTPFIRYSRSIPGERIQMDVCKITTGRYQYTAIDDCSRFRVLGMYSRRTAKNSIHFLERVVEQMPFPVQRVQTDRGQEFFAYSFQEKLKEYCIKFRPIKPRSPHLNGKVERSQQTDLQEFYLQQVDLKDKDLPFLLEQWQFHYNWYRPHSSLNNKTPMDIVVERSAITPFWENVEEGYDSSKEYIRVQSYKKQKRLPKIKGSPI